ncbi:alpha/beta hydrolase [Nocardiopsis aegyptia]|uniref:Pimeloyl-ACP methyl ester carboxylesterase n=1 Tax=Nocardiopsis aegyptia TaxID=220378 RepID=A0A7Z0EN89_9ACTN|nr:hypothetical protein [Nocardiopsis aegyptia]NYJ35022.1 pimeloyl-ACP methyl ester carboxylesterase [Nocardiopsis aegyptia]
MSRAGRGHDPVSSAPTPAATNEGIAEPLAVEELGSFHIGGREATLSGLDTRELRVTPAAPAIEIDPNGEFEVEQMYVQYVRLASPRARYPLLMWHGGGLSGVTWETTPDGRPGWMNLFLRYGHDVYVSDAVERGRASWARFPEIFATEPFFRSKQEAWEGFRIGPSWTGDPGERIPYPDSQFPVASFDRFAKQLVPRWATNDPCTQSAYDELVRHAGPCVILAHSQGAVFALRAAAAAPETVKAVVVLEPGGAPDPRHEDISAMRNTPVLCVWGDHVEDHEVWSDLRRSCERYWHAQSDQGGIADTIDLPEEGIRGNSHLIMMDRNSDLIAARVQQWLESRGFMK